MRMLSVTFLTTNGHDASSTPCAGSSLVVSARSSLFALFDGGDTLLLASAFDFGENTFGVSLHLRTCASESGVSSSSSLGSSLARGPAELEEVDSLLNSASIMLLIAVKGNSNSSAYPLIACHGDVYRTCDASRYDMPGVKQCVNRCMIL